MHYTAQKVQWMFSSETESGSLRAIVMGTPFCIKGALKLLVFGANIINTKFPIHGTPVQYW